MSGRVIIDFGGVKADSDRAALARTRSVARRILNRSAVLCPVDTGRLRASGRMKVVVTGRGPRGKVEYPVKYAAAVEDGSAPHTIKVRRRKALRFVVGGQVVYATSVRHPGTRPRPFLGRAAREIAAGEGLVFRRRTR